MGLGLTTGAVASELRDVHLGGLYYGDWLEKAGHVDAV
jgi:hypothetical protein